VGGCARAQAAESASGGLRRAGAIRHVRTKTTAPAARTRPHAHTDGNEP
jgi:hypothetical protein